MSSSNKYTSDNENTVGFVVLCCCFFAPILGLILGCTKPREEATPPPEEPSNFFNSAVPNTKKALFITSNQLRIRFHSQKQIESKDGWYDFFEIKDQSCKQGQFLMHQGSFALGRVAYQIPQEPYTYKDEPPYAPLLFVSFPRHKTDFILVLEDRWIVCIYPQPNNTHQWKQGMQCINGQWQPMRIPQAKPVTGNSQLSWFTTMDGFGVLCNL